MAMSFLTDDELDRAIDDAAQRMTAAEPGDTFRRRVLARIEEPVGGWGVMHQSISRLQPGRVVWAAASLAVAAALFALYVARDTPRQTAVPSTITKAET